MSREIFIRDHSTRESFMATASIFGLMEVFIRAVLEMAVDRAMEYGKNHQEAVTNIRDSIIMIKRMVTAFTLGTMETFIKATILKTRERATVKCIGQTAVITKEDGKIVNRKVREYSTLQKEGKKWEYLKIM